MIKFVANLDGSNGRLFGFGLTETNLNRLEFNQEPIFFDFGYAGQPDLYGLIFYLGQFDNPQDLMNNGQQAVEEITVPFLSDVITAEKIRVFPMARETMKNLRIHYSAAKNNAPITKEGDIQLFFSGPDEGSIRQYLQQSGFVGPDTIELRSPQ